MDENTAQEPERDAQNPPEQGAETDDVYDIPLPPASFGFLVLSLRSQAEMNMGLLHFGEEKDRPQPNLPLSRHAIDLLAMVQEKTKGNLSLEESRLIENSLTELRFRFVQVFEQSARPPAEPQTGEEQKSE